MGHCIQVIVAASKTADLISKGWPELPRLNCQNDFVIFPVDHELIDSQIAPEKTPTSTGDEFMLLTDSFRALLRRLSIGGELAYVETEYFGGVGGQGALVCRDGEELMPPTWESFGTINQALERIGMNRGARGDRFDAAGFGRVRGNDDLLELIASQSRHQDA